MLVVKLIFSSLFNDGKHAALVRRKDTNQYWITSVLYAETLDKNVYGVVDKTTGECSLGSYGIFGTLINMLADENPAVKLPVPVEAIEHHKVTKVHIRRPRNQFIIYRQWMSGRIHAENPGMTAAWICKFAYPAQWVPLTLDSSSCVADVARREA
jgi:hypothetical protein